MKWTLSVIVLGGLRPLRRCVSSVWKTFIQKKKKTEREKEKNVRGCWLVYRLCIDFSLSDTLIFHMEQSALSLPAFCLCLNSVLYQHSKDYWKQNVCLAHFFVRATFKQIQNKQVWRPTIMILKRRTDEERRRNYHSFQKPSILKKDPVHIYSALVY